MEKSIRDLCEDAPDLPDFSAFHPAFKELDGIETPEGDMRAAFFLYVPVRHCAPLCWHGLRRILCF